MNYYTAFWTLIILAVIVSFFGITNKTKKQRTIISLVVFAFTIGAAFLKFAVKPELEKQARYLHKGEVSIVWNPADQDYYINYLGTPLKLRDACPDEFGDYIDPQRVKNNMKVNVYEKTYLSKWGLKLATKPQPHFAHGRDVRLEQQAEIK